LAGAWQLLSLAGYRPLYETCISCGQKLTFPSYFSLEPCGGLCEKCAGENENIYTEEMQNFINQLLSIEWQNPGHFTVTQKTLLLTEKLIQNVLSSLIGKPLKSVKFIAAVKGIN
jgi:DNA repair protein RecO (recombination protein O)